eukprot:CAMPEP_0173078220 /NCGR_PEP_ID=MMETSP1102-20130122/13946_1 /TAXON_ID=49646 /ORGANISM="Geminigera sp., Strain Caron Lab Isolate" /LENGTH=116 /DNA_ID=CAMNT_0013949365 /DNA_START=418 /DNA_END=765 /DNA_ORIENTATION=-
MSLSQSSTTACCSVLQRVAACYSLLQRVAVCHLLPFFLSELSAAGGRIRCISPPGRDATAGRVATRVCVRHVPPVAAVEGAPARLLGGEQALLRCLLHSVELVDWDDCEQHLFGVI